MTDEERTMTAGMTEITMARAGSRIAVITPGYQEARDEHARLALLAGDDATAVFSSGRLAIRFSTGGLLRVTHNGTDPRGETYDQVIVHPDAMTDDLAERYAPTLATTGGDFRLAD